MELTSQAFKDGGEIPPKYSAAKENDVPPLEIRNVPQGTRSLVLLFEDIDAAIGPITHWLVWNLPQDTRRLDAIDVPDEARIGMNGYGKVGYTGPAPPAGRHHFRFRLAALDTVLQAAEGETRDALEHQMAGHVLAECKLTGYFNHPDPES